MSFGWINWINLGAVVCLILINLIAARKGLTGSMSSKHFVINIFEQIGRYGCMILMIFPILIQGRKFGFATVPAMVIWICATVLLLLIYIFLWTKKTNGKAGILYALAFVPVVLFLLNGILLRHSALVVFSLIFGVFHLLIVWENVKHFSGL